MEEIASSRTCFYNHYCKLTKTKLKIDWKHSKQTGAKLNTISVKLTKTTEIIIK